MELAELKMIVDRAVKETGDKDGHVNLTIVSKIEDSEYEDEYNFFDIDKVIQYQYGSDVLMTLRKLDDGD